MERLRTFNFGMSNGNDMEATVGLLDMRFPMFLSHLCLRLKGESAGNQALFAIV